MKVTPNWTTLLRGMIRKETRQVLLPEGYTIIFSSTSGSKVFQLRKDPFVVNIAKSVSGIKITSNVTNSLDHEEAQTFADMFDGAMKIAKILKGLK